MFKLLIKVKRFIIACVILLSLRLLCEIYWSQQSLPLRFIKHGQTEASSCPLSHAISAAKIGRLGNNMMTYANLFGIARTFGLFPYWQYGASDRLQIFQNNIIPDLRDVDTTSCYWLLFPTFDHFVVYYQRGDYNGTPVFIKGFSVMWQFENYQNEVKDLFDIKKALKDATQQKLYDVTARSGRSTFVGVHCRGTDYKLKFRLEYQSKLPNEVYYRRALNYFRRKYSDVIFMVVSDDLRYCMALLNKTGRTDDIYPAGNGDISSPGEDLAMMVACNHSILSLGTFGFWSGFLGNHGEVLYPTDFQKLNVSSPIKLKTYQQANYLLHAYMKSWIPISSS